MAPYQSIKFPLIPFILSEICSGQTFYCKKETNSVNTVGRVMVLALCNFPHGPLSVYQVSLNYLQYFSRYARTKVLPSGSIKKVSNGTSPPQELCQIFLKSMHKCRSYGPDKSGRTHIHLSKIVRYVSLYRKRARQ